MIRMFFLALLLVMTTACAPSIKTQAIPISTIPSGADVSVDGTQKLVAPCTVDLACTQDHILSLTKEGYEQQNVVIKRKYQEQKVLLKAINSGMSTGSFMDNAFMGISSGVSSIDSQENSGDAYVLVPSAVSIRLVPLQGFAPTTSAAEARQARTNPQSPLDLLSAHDEQMLENTLESSASGKTVTWTGKDGTTVFAVVPEDAQTRDNHLVRPFSLAAKAKDGTQTVKEYQGYRTGRGEWQISLPTAADQDDSTLNLDSKTVIRTLGEVAGEADWPSYDKSTKVSESSHKSTHYNSDGSMTTKESSSSVSAGVHVSPKSVFKLLDAFEGDN